jgi:hypothetical protein
MDMNWRFPSMVIAALLLGAVVTPLAAPAQDHLGRIELGARFPPIEFPRLPDGGRAGLDVFRGKRVLAIIFASW